jgi:AAA+ superfamily predicted ATPase
MAGLFRGKSAKVLHEFLTNCDERFRKASPRTISYYATYFSVCNSSGTGKTKTILQVSQHLIAFKTI